MRLLCLNAWGGRLIEPLLGFLREQRGLFDVITLQEVFDERDPPTDRAGVDRYAGTDLPIVPDLYQRCLRELTAFQGFLSQPYSSLGERLATFVRAGYRVSEVGLTALHAPLVQTVNETRFRANSIALHLLASLDGECVRVVNTHGLWIGGGKGDTSERIQQSTQLVTLLRSFPEPTVLCGDLNLDPTTESIRILEGHHRNLVREYGIPTTRSHLAPESKGKFADYVFVSPQVTVKDFRTLDVLVSDHLPLSVQIVP